MHTNTSNRNHSSAVVERPWPFLFRSQSGLTTLKITGLNYRHETKLPFPLFVFNAVENKKNLTKFSHLASVERVKLVYKKYRM